MRMRKHKAVLSLLALTVMLTACGGKEGEQQQEETAAVDKNAVYREEEGFLDLSEDSISTTLVTGETIYIDQMIYNMGEPQVRIAVEETEESEEEETEETALSEEEEPLEEGEAILEDMEMPAGEMGKVLRKITSFDFTGKELTKIEIEMEGNENASGLAVDESGNIYTIVTLYATYVGEDTKDKVYVKSYDKTGKELWAVHLNEKMGEEEYYYANQLFLDENNQLILDTSRGIEIFDLQGQPVKLIEKPEVMDCNLRKIREDKYAIVFSNGEKAHIQTVDTATGQLGEKIEIPFNYYRYSVQNGKYYDLYLSDEYAVYGYNMADTQPTKLMDYISSDFGGFTMYQITFLDETSFLGGYHGDMGSKFSKFTKVPSEEIADKTPLTLGCYYLDHKVKQRLIEFNRNNPEYKIHIIDYSIYDTMQDYTQGLTKLNTDIISGRVPDIMLLNQRMPINSYISKGLFVDFNELIEQDTSFKREDFLPNVFEALATEDGLYQLAPSFMVNTFAAKTKDVGKELGWTMEEAVKILEGKPEGTKLLSEMTSSNFLYYASWISIDDYVNWETGECFFNSPGFLGILEYAKSLPREIDYTAIMDDESYWNEMEAQYRNGKTILSMAYLSAFRDYQYLVQGTFGDEITLIGFPTDKGLGAGLSFSTNIAISAQSENQMGAWDFVKGFFTEEYQDSIEYEFPVRISSLNRMEEKAWERPYYEDENGNREEYDDIIQINGVEIKMKPLTKEETALVKEYIGKITNVSVVNEDIYNIILEEAESYFNDQKTAEDVAEVIQSRVKIYVNENR